METTPTDQSQNERNSQKDLQTGSEEDSLEGPSASFEEGPSPLTLPEKNDPGEPAPSDTLPTTKPPTKRWQQLIGHFNIYLLLFVLVLIVAIAIIVAAYLDNKHISGTSNLSSGSLSQSTLEQLANSDATVGSSSQVLNVQSSAIFAGKVLVRQDLEVAGSLQIGGTLALNNLSVAGTAQFGQEQINKNLSVAGDSSLQGAVTIAKSLQVSGSGSFGGSLSATQITTSNLQLSGDLILTHHITAGGTTPSRTNGSALGNGGTSSVSGSDTGGSITINTGSNPAAGCFVTINFTAKYNATPHILITPVGASAGGLNYYVNRSATSFSVCDATPAPVGASFGFDYFVVD